MTKQIIVDAPLAVQVAANSFPIKVNRELERHVVIIAFPRPVSTFEVLDEFHELALAAVDTPNLIAFGSQHPHAQGEYPIACIGGRLIDKRTYGVSIPLLYPADNGVAKISYCPVKAEAFWEKCGFIATMRD